MTEELKFFECLRLHMGNYDRAEWERFRAWARAIFHAWDYDHGGRGKEQSVSIDEYTGHRQIVLSFQVDGDDVARAVWEP